MFQPIVVLDMTGAMIVLHQQPHSLGLNRQLEMQMKRCNNHQQPLSLGLNHQRETQIYQCSKHLRTHSLGLKPRLKMRNH